MKIFDEKHAALTIDGKKMNFDLTSVSKMSGIKPMTTLSSHDVTKPYKQHEVICDLVDGEWIARETIVKYKTIMGRSICRPLVLREGKMVDDPLLIRALEFVAPGEYPLIWDADDWECCSDAYRLADLFAESLYCRQKAANMRVEAEIGKGLLPDETCSQMRLRLALAFKQKGQREEVLLCGVPAELLGYLEEVPPPSEVPPPPEVSL